MKYLLIILLLTTTAQAQVWDEFTRMDRLTHMGAGYVITSTSTAILYNYTQVDWHAELIGFSLGVIAGGMKEAMDYDRGGRGCKYDFAATVMGSTAAVVTFRIIIPDGRSRKQKYSIRFNN